MPLEELCVADTRSHFMVHLRIDTFLSRNKVPEKTIARVCELKHNRLIMRIIRLEESVFFLPLDVGEKVPCRFFSEPLQL